MNKIGSPLKTIKEGEVRGSTTSVSDLVNKKAIMEYLV